MAQYGQLYQGKLLAYMPTSVYIYITDQGTEQDTTYRYDQRSRMSTQVAL